MRWLGLSVLLLVSACGSKDPPPAPVGETSGGDGDADESGSDETTDEGGEETGPSEACKGCWQGVCDMQIDDCFADEDCTCNFACDGDQSCEDQCNDSGRFDALLECIIDASVGPCVDPCDTHCEACVYLGCEGEFDACFADELCLCKFNCEDDESCKSACGASSDLYETLALCFFDKAGNECADPCDGAPP